MDRISMSPEIVKAITNDYLKLILNPTERCNLRCTYCYETFSLGRMRRGVVSGVLNLVKRRAEAGLKLLEIEFFGGEPLAAWDIVETLAQNLHAICVKNNTSMSGGVTTNAILLNQARLDVLAANKITWFQVTLDGPKHVHDKRRISTHGTGSFGSVWAALLLLKASHHQVKAVIRLHFDPDTISELLGRNGFIRGIADAFVKGDDRFSLHFHALSRLGGSSDHTIRLFASKDEAQAALIEEALSAGCAREQLVGYLPLCYAARANSFIIRSDGRVAKCTVAFEDDRNTVGKLLENGDLVIDHARHVPWLRGLISGDRSELACPARAYLHDKPPSTALAHHQVTEPRLLPASLSVVDL
jgi:uncharacterized protein